MSALVAAYTHTAGIFVQTPAKRTYLWDMYSQPMAWAQPACRLRQLACVLPLLYTSPGRSPHLLQTHVLGPPSSRLGPLGSLDTLSPLSSQALLTKIDLPFTTRL